MTNLASLTPAEIDTFLAENFAEQQKLSFEIYNLVKRIESYEQTLERGGRITSWREQGYAEDRERLPELRNQRLDLIAASAPYENEFNRRGGWSRYFLVTNANGHVHRGLNCSTCYPTTEYAWLPELSDCDEAAMIEEFGEKACTVCFPTAPANPSFHGPGRRDREAQAARDAEKAARQAQKDAKAVYGPDGGPLRIVTEVYTVRATGERRTRTETFKTKIAARNALSSALESYGWYGPEHPTNFLSIAQQLAAALAETDLDPRPVIERRLKKNEKEGARYALSVEEVLATQA